MKRWGATAIVKGEHDLGYFEAETKEAAEKMAWAALDAPLGPLCAECSDVVDALEVVSMDVQEDA